MSDLNPRVDIVFKKLFGVEENKDLLISLINSIVSKEDEVEDIELLTPYNPRSFKSDKLSILDIKAKRRKDGVRYSIEIQVNDEADYDKRALYYWGKLYTEQLEKGYQYDKLNKSIAIHILHFTSIVRNSNYHNVFRIRDDKEKKAYFEDLELHTIELNKFGSENDQDISSILDKVKTVLDIWTAFLSKYELLDAKKLPKKLDTKEVRKAMEIVDVMNLTKIERDAYEGRLKWLRAEASALKKKFEEGVDAGIEKGIEKVVKNMLNENFDIEAISKSTGLSVEEIKKYSRFGK
jgi:predicted transposase/invertase (TIGR01784 family)